MCMLRIAGVFPLLPAVFLLILSFFVIFTIGKTENRAVRGLGYAAVILLWLSVAWIFLGGSFNYSPARQKMVCPMMEMMKYKQKPAIPMGMPREESRLTEKDMPLMKH